MKERLVLWSCLPKLGILTLYNKEVGVLMKELGREVDEKTKKYNTQKNVVGTDKVL